VITTQGVELLRRHIARVVRIHASCPLRDLTAACERVIAHARTVLPHVPSARPVSRFFEQDDMLSPFTDREGGDVRALFRAQFLEVGRLSYLARVLSFRPDYAEAFFSCQRDIMTAPGPLPVVWRHYIALLAAARHRSAYLCELQSELFLLAGGESAWLDGIAACPTKMQSYAALDAVTAHQPWLLKPANFSPLLRGADAWTVGELVHAIVISATFRALAGIVAGCGINYEADFVAVSGDNSTVGAATPERAPSPVAVDTAAARATERVIKRLQLVELTESGGLGGGVGGGGGGSLDEEDDQVPAAATVEQFNRAGEEEDTPRRRTSSSSAAAAAAAASVPAPAVARPAAAAAATALPAAVVRSTSVGSSQHQHLNSDGVVTAGTRLQISEALERETAYLSKFIGPHTMRHDDFDVHSRTYSVFRANDYSWPHQGYELLLRFLPRVAQPLDNLFSLTQTMTDHRFNTFDNVDTGPFRRAVWQYVQRTKGVLHDDYDYQDINVYLNKFNKSFIKKIVCYPEHVTAHDFQQLGYVMAPYEKLHLCALAVESRKQAELLYALHALILGMK